MSKFCANNCGIFQGAYKATYHLLEACQVMESSHWKSAVEGNPAKQPLPQNSISKNSKRTLEIELGDFSRALNWSSRPWTAAASLEGITASCNGYFMALAINMKAEEQRKRHKRANTQLAYHFLKHTLAFFELKFAFLYIQVVLFILYLGRIIELKGQLYQA